MKLENYKNIETLKSLADDVNVSNDEVDNKNIEDNTPVNIESSNNIIDDSISNFELNSNNSTLDEFVFNIREHCLFNNEYIMYVDGVYNIIDYEGKNAVMRVKNRQAIKKHIEQNFKNKTILNKIKFPVTKENIDKVFYNINNVDLNYSREDDKFYMDRNDNSIFNMFHRTDILRFIPERQIEWQELFNILNNDDKFKRVKIVVENVLTNNEEYIKYFFNWVSMEINCPRDLKTSIVLIGGQGSGKTLLTEAIFREIIYNPLNVCVLDNKTIKDTFNDIYQYKSFVIMNETSTSDLKESDQIAQELKRLITDDTYMQRGMHKSGIEKDITFNFIFCTNKDIPLQMDYDDRRFTVFGRSNKLIENIFIKDFINKNDEGHLKNFTNKFKEEMKEFLYLVKSLNFDRSVSTDFLMTESKQKIINSTNKISNLLKSYFEDRKLDKIIDLFKNNIFFDNEKEEQNFYKEFYYCFNVGIFDLELLTKIYFKLNIGNNKTEVGRYFNTFLKPSVLKNNGTSVNVKVFDEDNFDEKRTSYRNIKKIINSKENDILIEIQDKDGNVIKEYIEKQRRISIDKNNELNTLNYDYDDLNEAPF